MNGAGQLPIELWLRLGALGLGVIASGALLWWLLRHAPTTQKQQRDAVAKVARSNEEILSGLANEVGEVALDLAVKLQRSMCRPPRSGATPTS